MATIRVSTFLGIAPKMEASHLAHDQAQIAKDVKLWSGSMRPFRGVALSETLSKTGSIKKIHWYEDSHFLHWTEDVDAVPGPIADDDLEKLYFTGLDKPRVTTNELWDDGAPGSSVPPASYILGLPAPDTAPVATAAGSGEITASCAWVFTFVRKWSDGTVEESGPSPVSNVLSLAAQQASVTLPDGTMSTPADYGITHKRLYRTNGSLYFFVDELVFATASTADNVPVAELGDEIITTDFLPPPDGMKGLISLPNGVTAGFNGKTIYLSEPYRPHAYPLLNRYTITDNIVGLGNVGTAVIVLTDNRVWIGRGIDPAAYSFVRQPHIYPCVSKRSIVSDDFGVIWATSSGLAVCDGARTDLVTRNFLTRDEWSADFYPTTIHAVAHDGRYWAWYETGLDVDGNKTGGGFILDPGERAFLVKLGSYYHAAASIPESKQLMVVGKEQVILNRVYQVDVDASNSFVSEWKSKLFRTAGLENFAFARILADYDAGFTAAELAAIQAAIAAAIAANAAQATTDGALSEHALHDVLFHGDSVLIDLPSSVSTTRNITFKYWQDGELKQTRVVSGRDPFPMPAGFMGLEHEFSVAGQVEVVEVALATSVEELARA